MFNKALVTFFIALLTAVSVPAALAQEQKVGVVDVQRAILGSAYGQEQLAALDSDPEYAELLASLTSLQAEIQALDKDAQTNAASWTEARYATYQRQRQFRVADIELAQQKVQAEQERVINEINVAMTEQAQTALQELIEDEGVTVLLRASAVYTFTPEHDLTGKLAAKLSQ